jgi:sugar lactone lactonase YvrE
MSGSTSFGHLGRLGRIATLSTALVLALVSIGPANASDDVEKIIEFDEEAGQLPEGIAIDKVGNMFVSIAPLAELWRIPPGSTQAELFGSVEGYVPNEGFGLLGLAVDAPGNVFAAMSSENPDANGVWRFDRRTGQGTRIIGSEQIMVPNGLAFDQRGNLYVTDSGLGAIWRIPPGGAAELWLQHELLEPNGSLGIFVGANGVGYFHGALFVTNTEKYTLLVVDIQKEGTPGEPEVVAGFDLGAPDGLALGVDGDVFVALISASTIVDVDATGQVDVIAAGDPLDWESALAFGTGRGDRKSLFAVNFSIGEQFGELGGSGPGVVRVDVGVPGVPLP